MWGRNISCPRWVAINPIIQGQFSVGNPPTSMLCWSSRWEESGQPGWSLHWTWEKFDSNVGSGLPQAGGVSLKHFLLCNLTITSVVTIEKLHFHDFMIFWLVLSKKHVKVITCRTHTLNRAAKFASAFNTLPQISERALGPVAVGSTYKPSRSQARFASHETTAAPYCRWKTFPVIPHSYSSSDNCPQTGAII